MTARRNLAVIGLALLVPAIAGAAAAPGDLAATRALVKRLAAAGRGEAAVTVTTSDPMGGPDQVQRGRLALEPPDRVRLDFTGSGERIALRSDGGEWIQPAARQMLRLDRDQAGMAAWLWEVLLQGGTSGFSERVVVKGRYRLEPRASDTGLPDEITVRVDARGLPSQIAYPAPGGGTARYDFTGWRFTRARGPRAFTLSAPNGYNVVSLP